MGIPFGFGQRMLLDAQMRYVRSGLPVYLRIRNFLEQETDGTSSDYLDFGDSIAPSGTDVGYKDILIDPPPNVQDVSLHNIGVLAGRLNFGSRIFTISHTFVLNQMSQFPGITDPYEVWRDRDGYHTIGLFYNNRIFSIEDIRHREVAGETVAWRLICNALEQATTETTV